MKVQLFPKPGLTVIPLLLLACLLTFFGLSGAAAAGTARLPPHASVTTMPKSDLQFTRGPSLGSFSIGEVEAELAAAGGDGTYTWALVDGQLPPGVSLRMRPHLAPWWGSDVSAGLIGMATQEGSYSFLLRVTSAGQSIEQWFSITIWRMRLTSLWNLPDAFVGQPYYHKLETADAPPAVTWILDQPLPEGLTLGLDGTISGMPTTPGFTNFSVSIGDGPNRVGRGFGLGVYAVCITTRPQLPPAPRGKPYSEQIEAKWGTGPYTFTQDGGLPWGLTLAPSGEITGTPLGGAAHNSAWVTVTDSTGTSYSKRMGIAVTEDPQPLASMYPYGNYFGDCTFGEQCERGIGVGDGGVLPFTWEVRGLPPGMRLAFGNDMPSRWMAPDDAEIVGVPVQLGTFDVVVTLTDANGATVTSHFPLTVSPLSFRDFNGTAYRDVSMASSYRVIGGEIAPTATYGVTVIDGLMPMGVSLAPESSMLTGVPEENGNFEPKIRVTDAAANTLEIPLYLSIGSLTSAFRIDSWDLGSATVGRPYSYQLWGCCAASVVWTVDSGMLPSGMTLSPTGQLSGTPATWVPGTYTFVVKAADALNPANFGRRRVMLRVSTIEITTDWRLRWGNKDTFYSFTLSASGGVGPLTWSLPARNYLPHGLSLAPNGVLSGTPDVTGRFNFTLQVTDSAGGVATRGFSLFIYEPGAAAPLELNVWDQVWQLGFFGMPLSPSSIYGGLAPYSFSLTPQADRPVGSSQIPGSVMRNGQPLPTWFGAATLAGFLGVVAEPGVHHPSIRVSDSAGQSADREMRVTVPSFNAVSQWQLPRATAGTPYTFTMAAYPATGHYSWSATGLPSDFKIDPTTGIISGTPASIGTSNPTITLTDLDTNLSLSNGYNLTVEPFAITTPGALPPATSGVPYSVTLQAPDCGSPCYWLLANGGLPGGLTLNNQTGTIAGTPSWLWSGWFSVRASGSNGVVEKWFSLSVANPTVSPQPYVTMSAEINDMTVGQQVGWALWAQGGNPPYTWSVEPGSALPPGISLVNDGQNHAFNFAAGVGQLTGRPMAAGRYEFTVRVTDHLGASATRKMTWNVSRLAFVRADFPVTSNEIVYGLPWSQRLLAVGGSGNLRWDAPAGMPCGLSLAPDGLVNGVPCFTGTVNPRIRITDTSDENSTYTGTVNFTAVSPTLRTIQFPTGPDLGTQPVGGQVMFNITPAAPSWRTMPYVLTALTPLPPGLAIVSAEDGIAGGPTSANDWMLMGIATAPGRYTFTIEARDSSTPPNYGSKTFTLTVTPLTSYSGSALPDGSVGVAVDQPLTAFDMTGAAATWSLAPGSAFPPGLTITDGNRLTGTPTQSGNFTFSLSLVDADGFSTQRSFTMKVSPIHIDGDGILPPVVIWTPYAYTFTGGGGKAALTWTTSLAASSGLTLSSAGVLSGTRNSGAGLTSFTVTASDGTSSATRRFTLATASPSPGVLTSPIANTVLTDVVVGQSVNYTLSASDGVPPYTWSIAPEGRLPDGLRLLSWPASFNTYPGYTVLAGMAAAPGDYAFDLILTDAVGAQTRRTFHLRVSPLALVGTTFVSLTTGTAVNLRYRAVGGTPPYRFTASPRTAAGDSLPPGITLSSDGVLSGSTTSAGSYQFYLTTEDAANGRLRRTVSIDVKTVAGLEITATNPSPTWVGTYGMVRLYTSLGNNAAVTWSVVGGTLPDNTRFVPGMVASAPNLVTLLGSPGVPGVYSFRLRVTENGNPSNSAERDFTWKVGAMQLVSPAWELPSITDMPGGQVGAPYSFTLKMAGGTPPYRFRPTPFDLLPPGLSIAEDGTLSGTPTTSGSFLVAFDVVDAAGSFTEVTGLTMIVAPAGPPPPLVRTGSLWIPPSVGAPYAWRLDWGVRGGVPPYSWALAPGSTLPPGLSLIPSANGVPAHVAGTPTTAGSYAFRLVTTDSSGQQLTSAASLTVSALAVSPDLLPPGLVGAQYSVTLVPSGGVPPYTVALTTLSDLTPGLTFSSGGVLSGTPTHAGIFAMQLLITDSAGNTLQRYVPMYVDNALHEVPTVTLTPKPIQVYVEKGAPAPSAVPVTVAATSGPIPVTLMAGGIPGLSLGSTSGQTPVATELLFDVASLDVGTYSGVLGVNATGAANPGGWAPITLTVAPPPPCSYTVNPRTGSMPNAGGGGSFNVASGWNCSWSAASNAQWLTVTGGSSGTANGAVSYTAQPNPDPALRVGTITVNGAVYTVSQLGTACSFTISPGEVTATAAGGLATVLIAASSESCGWTASGGTLGVSPSSGNGSGAVQVSVPANLDIVGRTLTATIAERPFTVTQSGKACTVTLSPNGVGVPAGAYSSSVAVTTPAGCGWDTVLGPSWITVSSGKSGVGPGTLVVEVEPNSTTYPRAGALVIGGQSFVITQDALPCSVTLDTSGLGSPFGAAAGSGTIRVAANGPNCSWTAGSNVGWAVVSPTSGAGTRTLNVSVTTNADSTQSRSGGLVIAGQTVNLTQAGTVCTYALDSSSGTAPAVGGAADVRVIAPTACGWTSSSNAEWLTITASGSAGTSGVQVQVAPNSSALPRSGTIAAAGMTYTVDQAGAPCSYTMTGGTTSPLLAAGGAAAQVFPFTGSAPGCSPRAVSYANWITIDTTTYSGTDGSAVYSVAPTPYGVSRKATIQVGNALYTVVQSASACAYSLNAYGRAFGTGGGADTLLGSPNAIGCTPVVGTDMPSFITLGTLAGPTLNLFSLPYDVAPYTSLTPATRIGHITLGGQILTIKQVSW